MLAAYTCLVSNDGSRWPLQQEPGALARVKDLAETSERALVVIEHAAGCGKDPPSCAGTPGTMASTPDPVPTGSTPGKALVATAARARGRPLSKTWLRTPGRALVVIIIIQLAAELESYYL